MATTVASCSSGCISACKTMATALDTQGRFSSRNIQSRSTQGKTAVKTGSGEVPKLKRYEK